MRAAAHLVIVAATGGLASCSLVEHLATPPEPAPVSVAAASKSSAEDLFAYLARLRAMNESALSAEATRQRRETSDIARVKAALALSLMSQSEESEIIALVDVTARKDGADRDVRIMASFLHALATERRRVKESAAAAGVRLRDERRAHEAQKQRADALQQKLDALTELEKSLSDRQSSTR